MLNKAVDWKMIDSSPYKGVKHFRVNNTNLRILNHSEFQRLYQASSNNLKPILLTAINTGMRLSEVLNLKWSDINLKEGYLLVTDSKNYESRTISLNPTLKATLSRMGKESQSEYVFNGRKTIKRAWTNALRKSGIPHCRFHDLRHTFASNLVMNGYDLVTVAELMGHKDISMTKRYFHPTPQHKKQAIDSLNFVAIDTYLDTKGDSKQVDKGIESNLTILHQRIN
jgi:integrase